MSTRVETLGDSFTLLRDFPHMRFVPNGAPPGSEWAGQREAIRAIAEGGHKIFVLSTANGWGKTTFGVVLCANLISPGRNKYFDYPFFTNFHGPRCIRIISHPRHLADDGALQVAINKWFPRDALRKENIRRDKDCFRRLIRYNDWEVQMMSNQLPRNAYAGREVGVIIFDEPSARNIFSENLARTRAGGMVLITLTPDTDQAAELTEVAWIYEDLIEGEDFDCGHLYGGFEANCRQHGVNGNINHADLVAPLQGLGDEELEARARGHYRALGGLVHKAWADYRLPGKTADAHDHAGILMPSYNFRKWREFDAELPTLYMLLDPHDSKPFAILYFAQFADGTGQFVAEWPDESVGQPYHKMRHVPYTLEDYVEIIDRIERRWRPLRIYKRIIDRNYGNQMVARAQSKATVKQELTRISKGRLRFVDSCGGTQPWREAKHVLRGLLTPTPPRYVPRWRCFETLRNLDYAMRHYLMRMRSGRSADTLGPVLPTPAEKHKCFPNMVEWLALARPAYVSSQSLRPLVWYPESEYERVTGAR